MVLWKTLLIDPRRNINALLFRYALESVKESVSTWIQNLINDRFGHQELIRCNPPHMTCRDNHDRKSQCVNELT